MTKKEKIQMPKYQFQDRENKVFELLPAGDYALQVVGYEQSISKGAKTSGCEMVELTLRDPKSGCEINEKLLFSEKTEWRIDAFLKSCNAAPKKGNDVEFSEDLVLGLQGWAAVRVEEYKKQDGTIGKSNKVAIWYTDKAKLPRIPMAPKQAEPDPFAAAPEEDDVPF